MENLDLKNEALNVSFNDVKKEEKGVSKGKIFFLGLFLGLIIGVSPFLPSIFGQGFLSLDQGGDNYEDMLTNKMSTDFLPLEQAE